jgi:hypothetical protein
MNLTRRIIAISLTVIGGVVLAYLSVKGDEVALASLTSAVLLVIGFYFGDSKK